MNFIYLTPANEDAIAAVNMDMVCLITKHSESDYTSVYTPESEEGLEVKETPEEIIQLAMRLDETR